MTPPALLVLLLATVCAASPTPGRWRPAAERPAPRALAPPLSTLYMNQNDVYRDHTNNNYYNDAVEDDKYTTNSEDKYKLELDRTEYDTGLSQPRYREDENEERVNRDEPRHEYDEIYVEESEVSENVNVDRMKLKLRSEEGVRVWGAGRAGRGRGAGRRRRQAEAERCELFRNHDGTILHPHEQKNKTYYKNADCVTVVEAGPNQVIELTFVDQFEIEYHADCKYDYLEIRDGKKGYSRLLGKLCGASFPSVIQTSGPFAWLKFHSDDTIEYAGFKIHVNYITGPSHSVPESCYFDELDKTYGYLSKKGLENGTCDKESTDLDVLWTIRTKPNTKIYLNFTQFKLQSPNECEKNVVEVFGSKAEEDYRLVQYCGSIANPVSTKDEKETTQGPRGPGNVMHVRLFVAQAVKKDMKFRATYVAYRSLNPNNVNEKCSAQEFDCDDNTCIDKNLRCHEDGEAHCRLKTDVDPEKCSAPAANQLSQTHIIVILVIFCLILSAMSFVFLYKCIRKLYQDHQIIKEHIRQSCEGRLDALSAGAGSRLTLDAGRLRASLERDNRANRRRDTADRGKESSIDSEYIQETELELEEEEWRREMSEPGARPERERDGRTRRDARGSERQDRRGTGPSERHDRCENGGSIKRDRRDTLRGERHDRRDTGVSERLDRRDTGVSERLDRRDTGVNERLERRDTEAGERHDRRDIGESEKHDHRSDRTSIRNSDRKTDSSKKEESLRRSREAEERRGARGASAGRETKDSGCQTRESLFQAPAGVAGSGATDSSGAFSTFGYSGAALARPSPPAPLSSELTIELLRQLPRQDSRPQKKLPDRRPVSAETTRSAPDVIIVSKPLR